MNNSLGLALLIQMKELSDRPNAMKPKKGWTLTVVLKAVTQGKILGIASLFNLLTSATVPVKAKNCNF
jgi:hypothetical protein